MRRTRKARRDTTSNHVPHNERGVHKWCEVRPGCVRTHLVCSAKRTHRSALPIWAKIDEWVTVVVLLVSIYLRCLILWTYLDNSSLWLVCYICDLRVSWFWDLFNIMNLWICNYYLYCVVTCELHFTSLSHDVICLTLVFHNTSW